MAPKKMRQMISVGYRRQQKKIVKNQAFDVREEVKNGCKEWDGKYF